MPTRPLRIVHVIASTNGAPWLLELMREQRSRGHEVSAIIPSGEGAIPRFLEAEGFLFTRAGLDLLASGPLHALRSVVALAFRLRTIRADVVQYHLFPSILMGRLAAWLADAPLRFSMIPGTYYLEAPVLGELETGTAWADTRVIATCEKTRDLYLDAGVASSKLEVIHYGVNPATFDPSRYSRSSFRAELGLPDETALVGLVAYFYPKTVEGPFSPRYLVGRGLKGHDVLLRAVPGVLERVPDARFVFIGGAWGEAGAGYLAEMKSLARGLGVADKVIFSGETKDVPRALASLDVALQCSLCENLGGSIEALLMERPLVVTRVGGLVDSVKDRKTGLVVPPGDPEALAAAIVELLERRDLAAELGRNGRRFMLERFTVSYLADALDRLYERCATEERLDPARPREKRYRTVASALRALAFPFRALPLWFRVHRAIAAGLWSRRFEKAARLLMRIAFGGPLRLIRRSLRRRGAPAGRPVRVAQVVGTSIGCEWMILMARGLRDRGYEVCALIDTAEGTLPGRLAEAGIPMLRVPMTFAVGRDRLRLLHYAIGVPLSSLRMAQLLRRERIDIVHTHIFSSIVMARLAATLAGTPRIVSMIPGPRHLEAALTRIVDGLTQGLDDATVAGCRFTEEIYRRMDVEQKSVQCIYYGADSVRFDPARANGARVRRELGIATDAPVVGLVAQFYPPMYGPQNPPQTRGVGLKGHEHFLQAARIVRRKFPSAVFVLAGDGHGEAGEAYRRRLMSECESGELRGAVIFTGHREDIPDVLSAFDVAVQCSLSENLGGTIESLLMERPTVATMVGGMPEAVIHEETGLLVPPCDPQALAEAIVRLLSRRDEAESFARAGRRRMLEQFTMEKTVTDVAALYEKLRRREAASPPNRIRAERYS